MANRIWSVQFKISFIEGDAEAVVDDESENEEDGGTEHVYNGPQSQPVIEGSSELGGGIHGTESEETVDANIVEEIINDLHTYESTGSTESRLRRSERIKNKQALRDMLTTTVSKFVGLGLQMELWEAREKYGTRSVRAAADEIKQILKKKVWHGVTEEDT